MNIYRATMGCSLGGPSLQKGELITDDGQSPKAIKSLVQAGALELVKGTDDELAELATRATRLPDVTGNLADVLEPPMPVPDPAEVMVVGSEVDATGAGTIATPPAEPIEPPAH